MRLIAKHFDITYAWMLVRLSNLICHLQKMGIVRRSTYSQLAPVANRRPILVLHFAGIIIECSKTHISQRDTLGASLLGRLFHREQEDFHLLAQSLFSSSQEESQVMEEIRS